MLSYGIKKERMDIEQAVNNIRNAVDVVQVNGLVLIHANEQEATKLYGLLQKVGCLEGRTHILTRDNQECQQNVIFKHSTHHINDDIERCNSAYVILPRTRANHNLVMEQFFHTIPLPNVPVVTGREVYALDYINRTCKVFLI